MAAKPTRKELLQTLNPYTIPTVDETMIIAQYDAEQLVRSMMVDKHVIPEADADFYENGCLVAAWQLRSRYDATHIAKRTGKPCPFASYIRFVMRSYLLKEARTILSRAKLAPTFSMQDDPEALDKFDADALLEIQNAVTTADHDRLVSRLDLEWIIEALPKNLREPARLVYLQDVSVTGVPKRLGISKSWFFHGPSAEMKRLVEEGLREALG